MRSYTNTIIIQYEYCWNGKKYASEAIVVGGGGVAVRGWVGGDPHARISRSIAQYNYYYYYYYLNIDARQPNQRDVGARRRGVGEGEVVGRRRRSGGGGRKRPQRKTINKI